MSSLAVSAILISTSCHKLNMTSVNLAGNNIDCLRDEGGIFSPGYDYFRQRLTGSLICTVKTRGRLQDSKGNITNIMLII